MRFTRLSLALLASLTLTSGCVANDFSGLNEGYTRLRLEQQVVAVKTLSTAAMATQLALVNVALAMADQATAEAGGTLQGVQLRSPMPGWSTAYSIDHERRVGQVKAVKEGAAALNLAFRFEKQGTGDRATYIIRDLQGPIEGYELHLPIVTVQLSPRTYADGRTFLDASGRSGANAAVFSGGTLNYQGAPIIDITETRMAIEYPMMLRRVNVGTIHAVRTGLHVYGTIHVDEQNMIGGQGEARDDAGNQLYFLRAAPGREIEVSRVGW